MTGERNVMPRHLRIGAALALAGSLALALAGCAKKKSVVDPSFTIPEGVFSSELELITFLDQPNNKIRMLDRGRLGKADFGPDTNTTDQIELDPNTLAPKISAIRASIPGTVHGVILNRSAAEGIEIFRSEANGSVRPIFSFPLQTSRRWVDGRSELYEFTDSDPKRAPGATYFARGLIGGVGGAQSPISNSSRPNGAPITEIRYLAERWGTFPGESNADAESTFYMLWTPVNGASRYLIHVFEYQSRVLSQRERIITGAPAPLMTLAARDIFIASVPATAAMTGYKMGAAGATIYTFGTTTGPPIAQTRDLERIYRFPKDESVRDFFTDFTDPEVTSAPRPTYLLYSRGAYWVSPGINPRRETRMERSR
jgi:hypothetical protein